MRLDLCEEFCEDGAALQRQTTSAISSSAKPSGLLADAMPWAKLHKKLSVVYKRNDMPLVNSASCAAQISGTFDPIIEHNRLERSPSRPSGSDTDSENR